MLVDLDPKSLGRFGAVRGGARGIYLYYITYIYIYIYLLYIYIYILFHNISC